MNKTNEFKSIKKPTYDVFLSYSSKDADFSRMLYSELSQLGITSFLPSSTPTGASYIDTLMSAISSTKYFVPIITSNFIESIFCKKEFDVALQRSKSIVPIVFSFYDIPYNLADTLYIQAKEPSPSEASRIAKIIFDIVHPAKKESENFELLSEYIKSGATNKSTKILCELIKDNCEKIFKTYSYIQQKELINKLFPLLDKLNSIYAFEYSPEAHTLARKKKKTLEYIREAKENLRQFELDDLFFISAAIRFIYYEREITWDCEDALTDGDLSNGVIRKPRLSKTTYEKKQHDYVLQYEHEIVLQSQERYTDDEWQFILETPKYIYKKDKYTPKKEKTTGKKTPDDDLLKQVASFMREGNKIFDLISGTEQAEDFFNCLILSYERLKKYCELVGEEKICGECIDRIFELKQKTSNGIKATEVATKARDGIKILLGLAIPKSGEFDVFISHKTEDTDIAEDMYHYLQQNLKEAFYDKESLPEMSESKYRKSIMRALDGSTHFVLILSKLEYLDSYWVQLEMDVFQSEMDEGRKPDSNFIMVVTNDVYDQIMASNKTVIPIEYRRCEIMKVEEYKTKLLSYLSKKH